jgi:acetyl esterase/lipase
MHVFEALLDDGRPPEQLIVAGDSGGGGLATSLFEDVRTEHLPEPAGAVLFSPEVDLVMGEPSVTANARHDVLPDQIPVLQYLAGADPHDPRVSVVYADVQRFPSTFVAYGDREMFRDEIVEFIGRLRDARVSVQVFEAPFLFHVYEILMPWATASKATIAAVAGFVDRRLARTFP